MSMSAVSSLQRSRESQNLAPISRRINTFRSCKCSRPLRSVSVLNLLFQCTDRANRNNCTAGPKS